MVFDPGLPQRLLRAGATTVRFESRVVNDRFVEVLFRADDRLSGTYPALRVWEGLCRQDVFGGFGRDATVSVPVLRQALRVAVGFASQDPDNAEMHLGCIHLTAGRMCATDGTKAVLLESKTLPRARASIHADAVGHLAQFLRANSTDEVFIAVAPGRVRFRVAANGATLVAIHRCGSRVST